jgi:hypothetical protein
LVKVDEAIPLHVLISSRDIRAERGISIFKEAQLPPFLEGNEGGATFYATSLIVVQYELKYGLLF